MKARLALLLFATSLAACKPKRPPPPLLAIPRLSTIATADPAAAPQLRAGFHDIEESRFRWTAKQFRAVLRGPGPGHGGARLRIALFVPASALASAPSITLRCKLDDYDDDHPEPATYSKAGAYVYERVLPKFAYETAHVDCTLDHAIAPGALDGRELGVIVNELSIEPL